MFERSENRYRSLNIKILGENRENGRKRIFKERIEKILCGRQIWFFRLKKFISYYVEYMKKDFYFDMY